MADRIHSIDAVRGAAMACIVVIHADLFLGLGHVGNAANFVFDAIGRFAVPIFFLTSGYLLAAACSRADASYARRYVSRVTTIYAGGVLLAIPLVIGRAAIVAEGNGRSVSAAVVETAVTALSPLDLLYYGDSVLFHFWFLPALLYSVLAIRAFDRVDRLRALLAIGAGLHAVGILAQLTLIALPFRTRDALFFGLFYTTIGYVMQRRDWPTRRRPRTYLLLVVLLAAVQPLERYAFGYVLGEASMVETVYTPEYSLLTLPYVLAIAAFALSAPAAGRDTWLTSIGAASLVVYVFHPAPLFGLRGLFATMGVFEAHPLLAGAVQLAVVLVALFGTITCYRLLARTALLSRGRALTSRASRLAGRAPLP